MDGRARVIDNPKPGHIYRIRSNNLRVGVYVPHSFERVWPAFIGVREKGHPRNAFLHAELLHTDGKGTVREVLEDLGPVPTALGPLSTTNRALFGYLYKLEESLGYTFMTVEEYEGENQRYLEEMEGKE